MGDTIEMMSTDSSSCLRESQPPIESAKVLSVTESMQSIKIAIEKTSGRWQNSSSITANTIRRILASTKVLIGFTNTINIITRIGNLLSIKNPELSTLDIEGYSPDRQCVDLGSTERQCCSFGISRVSVFCQLSTRENYTWAMIGSCVVWTSVILTQLGLNWNYNTNDLRYYASLERAKTHWATKFNCFLVFILTMGCMIYTMIAVQGFDHWPENDKQVAHVTILLQGVINVLSVAPLLDAKYPHLKFIHIREQFPNAVTIHHSVPPVLGNLYGLILRSDDVLRCLNSALIKGLIHNNNDELKLIGNPDEIKQLIQLMTGDPFFREQTDLEEEEKK